MFLLQTLKTDNLGSTYQKQAVMLARHFENKSNDFILPPLELVPDSEGNIAVIVDGKTISINFEKHMMREQRRYHEKESHPDYERYLDTSEVEKEHGAG